MSILEARYVFQRGRIKRAFNSYNVLLTTTGPLDRKHFGIRGYFYVHELARYNGGTAFN